MLYIIFFAFDPHNCVSLQLPQVRARARAYGSLCAGVLVCVRRARRARRRWSGLCAGVRGRVHLNHILLGLLL